MVNKDKKVIKQEVDAASIVHSQAYKACHHVIKDVITIYTVLSIVSKIMVNFDQANTYLTVLIMAVVI